MLRRPVQEDDVDLVAMVCGSATSLILPGYSRNNRWNEERNRGCKGLVHESCL